MSQLILTAHTGIHDAGAALFEDYNLLAAVQLERLTRFKCDGRDHPDLAIDEVLSIAGKTRQDVDVAGFSRCFGSGLTLLFMMRLGNKSGRRNNATLGQFLDFDQRRTRRFTCFAVTAHRHRWRCVFLPGTGVAQLAAPFFADRHGASINTNPACGFHPRVYQLC
jgi:hypothetical protein